MKKTPTIDILFDKITPFLSPDDIKRYRTALYKTLQLDQPENRARLNDCHSIYKYSVKEIDLSHRGKTPKSAKYSPDGSKLLITYTEGCIYLNDLKKPENSWLINLEIKIEDIIFSPDNTKIIIMEPDIGVDLNIQLWCLRTREKLWQKNKITTASFSKEGDQVITSNFDGMLQKLDTRTGETKHEFRLGDRFLRSYILQGGARVAQKASIYNRKQYTLKIYNTNTRAHTHTIESLHIKTRFTFTEDGNKVLLIKENKENIAILWNFETSRQEWQSQKHALKIYLSQISQDGRIIVTASWDDHLRIWDTRTGQSTTIGLIQPLEKAYSISISPKHNIMVVTNKRALNLRPSNVQF